MCAALVVLLPEVSAEIPSLYFIHAKEGYSFTCIKFEDQDARKVGDHTLRVISLLFNIVILSLSLNLSRLPHLLQLCQRLPAAFFQIRPPFVPVAAHRSDKYLRYG